MSETVPFEGVEKRLVIQFADGLVHYDPGRELGEGAIMKSPFVMSIVEWQSVLDYASCEIVSVKELATSKSDTADVRVYLLSESTLTVWRTGFLMKTCGRTTPFLALQRILDLYRCKSLSDLHVSWMTYSRLDFLYPEYQPAPHRNFGEEVEYVQRNFMSCIGEESDFDSASTTASEGPVSPGGGAGSVSGGTASETRINSLEKGGNLKSFKSVDGCSSKSIFYAAIPAGEHVLYAIFATPTDLPASGYSMEEVLMTNVRKDCVGRLTGADNKIESLSASIDTSTSLIRRTLEKSPNSVIDEFWFDPCGYSANILFESRSQTIDYFSTHISPEPCSSYASLELGSWGHLSTFERNSDEFSIAPLIRPFAAKHHNHTRITISPVNGLCVRADLGTAVQSPTRGTPVGHRSFTSNSFTCEILHYAK